MLGQTAWEDETPSDQQPLQDNSLRKRSVVIFVGLRGWTLCDFVLHLQCLVVYASNENVGFNVIIKWSLARIVTYATHIPSLS